MKYEVKIKIRTNADDEEQAENKAWEFLCNCSRRDVCFDVYVVEE